MPDSCHLPTTSQPPSNHLPTTFQPPQAGGPGGVLTVQVVGARDVAGGYSSNGGGGAAGAVNGTNGVTGIPNHESAVVAHQLGDRLHVWLRAGTVVDYLKCHQGNVIVQEWRQ